MNNTDNSIPSIQSFSDLVKAISEEERTKYIDVLRSLQISREEFESYESWSDEGYTRNCIVENEAFELILICWGAGQATPIHDHGGEECWVNVLEGEIHEKMYEQDTNGELNCTKTSKRLKGEISYMVDFMGYHRLENNSTSRACTLHLYAKPIRNCNIFDAQAQEFVDTEMTYHTVANLQTT